MPPSPLLGLTNTDVRSSKLNVIYNFYLQASIGLQQQEIFNSDNFYNAIRSIHNRLSYHKPSWPFSNQLLDFCQLKGLERGILGRTFQE